MPVSLLRSGRGRGIGAAAGRGRPPGGGWRPRRLLPSPCTGLGAFVLARSVHNEDYRVCFSDRSR
jgi:hypothetical protein